MLLRVVLYYMELYLRLLFSFFFLLKGTRHDDEGCHERSGSDVMWRFWAGKHSFYCCKRVGRLWRIDVEI